MARMSTGHATTVDNAVDRLLDVIAGGLGREAAVLYEPGAVLDATVPGWRFQKHGGEAIAGVWAHWFAEPGRFTELERLPVTGGEVVQYTLAGEENGVPFVAHHCHIVTVDDASGRIARHQVWCGGRWYPERMAEMEEAQRAEDAALLATDVPATG
jgi:hypothetical protein